MAEAIPSGIEIVRSRLISAFTQGAFEPLVGSTKFSEFNSGQSDHWVGLYTFQPLGVDDTLRLMAWVRRLKRSGEFYAYDPKKRVPQAGVVSGLTYGGATGDVIGISGGDPSTTILTEGDYIQVGDQFFQLLGDATTDGVGDASVQVWPTPRSGLSVGNSVVTENPVMLARITSPVPEETDGNLLTQITISWEQKV